MLGRYALRAGIEFQSAPPAREATMLGRYALRAGIEFQSAPPAREATRAATTRSCALNCFNPRLPRGRRRGMAYTATAAGRFQSAPPAREATRPHRNRRRRTPVSIRASRAGGDAPQVRSSLTQASFNPRLPRGRRRARPGPHRRPAGFNPRLPRGRRRRGAEGWDARRCFNPRLPRGRRQDGLREREEAEPVSIRASRAGGDVDEPTAVAAGPGVSIRASRAGGDAPVAEGDVLPDCFNPRLPRGRRRSTTASSSSPPCFNPRLPRGRRRHNFRLAHVDLWVSIRASRAGGDQLSVSN